MQLKEHYKKNFILAYPVMLSHLGQVLVGVADSVMVGRVGPIELAGASFGNAIFYFFMTFGLGVSLAITPLVAMADGEGDKTKCGKVLRHGFLINFVLGLLLMGIMLLMVLLLENFGQAPEVVAQAKSYLVIIAISMMPFMVFQTFRQFAEGLSMTKQPMYVSLLCNILNVVLNYIFIFGKLGFPELGLYGAGLATLISRVAMAVGMMVYVLFSERFKPYLVKIRSKVLEWKQVMQLLEIGVPAGLQFIFEVGAFGFAAIMIGWLGALPLAAHQIAISLASISYMAVSGMAAAATIRVGNQLGRKDIPTLRMAVMTIFIMGVVLMSFSGIIFVVGREFLPSLYIENLTVIRMAAPLLIVAALFQLSDGIQVIGLGALRGMSDVKIPTIITFVSYWIFALPIGYVLSFWFKMGALGVWLGLFLGLTLSAGANFIRYRKKVAKLESRFVEYSVNS